MGFYTQQLSSIVRYAGRYITCRSRHSGTHQFPRWARTPTDLQHPPSRLTKTEVG